MKKLVFLSILFAGAAMQAGDLKSYQTGVLKEMTSVECGYEQKSANTLVGEVLGTDSSHSKTRKTLCHEYVLQANHVIYHIRPRDEKHPALLPVGETAHLAHEVAVRSEHHVLERLRFHPRRRSRSSAALPPCSLTASRTLRWLDYPGRLPRQAAVEPTGSRFP